MQRLFAILSGMLFGAGLALSGMVNPMKVQNFLDILGRWDPTLLFVMGGGLAVTFAGYRLVMRRPAPLYAAKYTAAPRRGLDARLLGGAAIFGVGWGLTGFCPGPAIASLVFGLWLSVLFVAAMAVGMFLVRWIPDRTLDRASETADG